MDFLQLAKERFSCRSFSDKAVEPEKLDAILAAGLAAPTAVNKQPYHIWLIKSETAYAEVTKAALFPFVPQCHVALVVGSLPEAGWVREADGKPFADVDAAIVATHLLLAIQDQGLRTTWVGRFDPAVLKAAFPEMAPYNLIAIFPIGYPAEDGVPSARHSVRRSKEEAVTVL